MTSVSPGSRCQSDFAVRAVTRGPRHHFFGYYDKSCWDGGGRRLLCLETEFLARPPTAADSAAVGVVDLEGGGFRALGRTRAWCWQQSSMLHWLPSPHASGHVADRGPAPETPWIIHNDRLDPGEQPERPSEHGWDDFPGDAPRFVAVVREAETGAVVRTLPRPVYALSRDGRQAVTLSFSRLQHQRPGYGYPGVPDPGRDVPEPEDDGIWWLDVETGANRLILSLAEVAAIERGPGFDGAVHRFNHLQFSPDDRRFVFLHRWQTSPDAPRHHRMITARPDGGDLAIVACQGAVSHFDWRDPDHILAWAFQEGIGQRYLLFRDRALHQVEVLGEGQLTDDGHCSYSPDGRWLLTDTYPRGGTTRDLILYDLAGERRVDVGRFHSPPAITGEIRCDLHPRWNRDGTQVCIDSAHEGHRQLYIVDVSRLTAGG